MTPPNEVLSSETPGIVKAWTRGVAFEEQAKNYVDRESHYEQEVWVTRKGAVRARQGDLGIIPGSIGARSYIVEGLGQPESFCSCSHGAGRRMSRSAARKAFSLDQHRLDTEGIECRKDVHVLDEPPRHTSPSTT